MTQEWGNIFLVGPVGAGKSRIGSLLAKALKRKFYDSDHTIEKNYGVDIAWLIELEGEAGFRAREEDVIEQLTAHKDSPIILATGGGVVLSAVNRACIASRGTVVYLKTTVDEQMQRIWSGSRPLLGDPEPKRLQLLNSEREPYYDDLADITIQTAGRAVIAVKAEILKALEEWFSNERK